MIKIYAIKDIDNYGWVKSFNIGYSNPLTISNVEFTKDPYTAKQFTESEIDLVKAVGSALDRDKFKVKYFKEYYP